MAAFCHCIGCGLDFPAETFGPLSFCEACRRDRVEAAFRYWGALSMPVQALNMPEAAERYAQQQLWIFAQGDRLG